MATPNFQARVMRSYSFITIANALEGATVRVAPWGGRVVSANGYNGSVELAELTARMERLFRMRLPTSPDKERAKVRIQHKLQHFYQLTAHSRSQMGWIAWLRDIWLYGLTSNRQLPVTLAPQS